MNFTLHTEVTVSPPEFTVTCRTEGGPATNVTWRHDGAELPEDYNKQSQIILDTSQNSVYENRLRVRGRESGIYLCSIDNVLSKRGSSIMVEGLCIPIHYTLHQSNHYLPI